MKPICITSGPPTRKRERNRFWQGNTKVITILSLKLMQHIQVPIRSNTLRKRCPNSKLFWSTLLRISPYSVRMWENTDQNNSEYGHFLRSDSQYMTLLFHVAPDGRIIEIKHNLEKIEIHRAYQCYNILRGSFSKKRLNTQQHSIHKNNQFQSKIKFCRYFYFIALPNFRKKLRKLFLRKDLYRTRKEELKFKN